MNRWIKAARRVLGAVCAAELLLAAACAGQMTASAAYGYDDDTHCLRMITEPDAVSDVVSFHRADGQVSADQMTWVDDGVHGKALSLDGTGDYLWIGYDQLRISQMTFATWINFRGSIDPANPAGAYWQRLFTVSYGESRYFTVSPHALDTEKTKEDGQLDGVYMSFYRGDDEAGGEAFSMEAFTGARPGRSSLGLPQNEWHHVAVVADSQTAKLYIDGNLILDEILMISPIQMNANQMLVGGGLWGDPMLNASLDDTMLFDIALTPEQIASLMQTGDPANMTGATTSTAYLPAAPVTTVPTTGTTEPVDKPATPLGLPMWGFRVVLALLALMVILTVAVNIYEAYWRRHHRQEKEGGGSEEEPQISIKEAARRKRQEEKARFDAEEDDEWGGDEP